MHIRPEVPADFAAIDDVVAAAFERVDEARLVRLIRDSEFYVPELALVAEDAGAIVGHIMLSYVDLTNGSSNRVLSLAPLSVRPDRQRVGIGIALTNAALDAATKRGEPLVIVLGHPHYYPRFGFEPARRHGIEPPDPKLPDEVFMVARLPNYDPQLRGRIHYPSAFDVS